MKRFIRVLLIWIALILVGGELAARLYADVLYQSPLPDGSVGFEESPLLPDGIRSEVLRLTPNYTGTANTTGITYSINTWGFRDDSIDWTKQHVLFLGDSTTFGLNIPHETTYAEVWEHSAGIDWQAVNTAIPGRGMISSYETFQAVLDQELHPRAVVIGFFGGNDPRNDANYGITPSHDSLYLVRIGRYFVDMVHRQTQSELAISLDYLGRIIQLAQEQQAQPIVIYIAYNNERVDSPIAQAVKQAATDYDVPFINTLELYADYLEVHNLSAYPDDFYSVPGDMAHPGILSSQLIGEALYEVYP